jgi:hypothetical protein
MARSVSVRGTPAVAAVLDLNAVRLDSLRRAVRTLMRDMMREALLGRAPASDDRVQWAFALGQVHVALEAAACASRGHLPRTRAESVVAYRALRDDLARVRRWCDHERGHRGCGVARHDALASASRRLRSVLRESHRAPFRRVCS